MAFIACFIAVASLRSDLPVKLFAVQTRLMAPSLSFGSLIFTQPAPSYELNEIIAFNLDNNILTQRIQEVRLNDSQVIYLTQTDVNKRLNTQLVSQDQIIGKVMFSLPYFGYLIIIAKNRIGLVFLIGLPVFLLFRHFILDYKKHQRRKKRK